MIKKVRIFTKKNNDKTTEVCNQIEKLLNKNNITLSTDDFDLGIAVGGDGSFLKMVKQANFNTNCLYVGINTGTLGFAQELNVEDVEKFINSLNKEELFYEEIGIEEIIIKTKKEEKKVHALNEIVIRENQLKAVKLDVIIDNELLETFLGDGLLISTSFGSTAYNASLKGSIVYNSIKAHQITPISPLNNKHSHNLLNSVIIPSSSEIIILPKKDHNDLFISVDGDNKLINNVEKITVRNNKKDIKVVRLKNYNFTKKINDKLVK